jgi:WD40 repeat protein
MSSARLAIIAATLLAEPLLASDPPLDEPALPPGARVRLGTVVFRHADHAHSSLRFPAGGKTLLSCDGRTVILWDLQTGKKLRTCTQGWLYAVSPNGKTLALLRTINELLLVDVDTGKEVCKVDAKEWIRSAAFSADSESLFTGGDKRVIRAWQASDGKALRQFKDAPGSVGWLSPSADGKVCLCLADVAPSSLLVYDVGTGKRLRTLLNVNVAAATPDAKTVVAARAQSVLVWDTATGKERLRFQGCGGLGGIRALAISPDGNTVALAGYDRTTFRVVDLSNGKPKVLLDIRGDVYALAFSGDGQTLAAAGWGGVIRLWRWRDGKELYDGGHRDAVVSLAFAPDSKTRISRGMDHTVRMWEIATAKETRRFDSHDGGASERERFFFLFHMLDDRSLLRSVAEGVGILDVQTGAERSFADLTKETPAGVSPDGRTVITYQLQGSASDRSTAVIFGLWEGQGAGGKKIREFTHSFRDAPPTASAGASPVAAAVAPDGKTIAVSWFYLRHKSMYMERVGHGVSIFDVATGKERRIGASGAADLAFIDGGKTLVCAEVTKWKPDRDKDMMEFWDVASGKKLRELQGRPEWRNVLAFSPDGKLFATASEGSDHAVYLWRTANGGQIKRFAGHERAVESLAFSPDGRMLASGGRDTTILVWEVVGLH